MLNVWTVFFMLLLALVLLVVAFFLGAIAGWWYVKYECPQAWDMFIFRDR